MVQFHETVMGKRSFENTMPALAEEIHKLKSSNTELATALLEEIHKLNENLKPRKIEQAIAESNTLHRFIADGWRATPTVFKDGGMDYIVVEREVE